MIPVTYGYARVSKADRDDKNQETQLRELAHHGLRREFIFVDDETGTTFKRQGWTRLMERVQPGDTIVVVWQDRFGRNFDEGVAIQGDLTRREIWIVAIRENIDTRDGSAGGKFYRRMMLVQGAYQADSTSERVRAGLDRARAEGKKLGRPPALTREQVLEAQRIYAENPSIRRTTRILGVSQGTVKSALEEVACAPAGEA